MWSICKTASWPPDAIAGIAAARDIVPTANRISPALRDAGGLVVYIRNTFDDVAIQTWPSDHFCSSSRLERMIEAFTPGSRGPALWADLDGRPEDLVARKRRSGAFAPGSSGLHDILHRRGVDTLIITGTASQVCR